MLKKASRHLFLLFVILLNCWLSACAAKPVLRGELQGEIIWQGEVRLQGNVILAEDAVLTIEPGTKVVFLPLASGDDLLKDHPYFPGSELIVRGQIIAKGTAAAPIQFQSVDPAAGPGSWGGINIEESQRAIFEFCTFRQADSAVHARDSWVVVENSLFTDNLVGVRFHDTNILIEKNLFQDNGTAIRFHYGSPVICKNIMRNNGKGLFISSEPHEYTIENNSFLANFSYEVSLGEGVRNPVLLKNNFWGHHSTESLPSRLYDGRIDDWLGTVDFQPLRTIPDPDAGGVWKQ